MSTPTSVPTRPATGWWRRNRLALIGLVVLVPLALLTASFRMVAVYVPWSWVIAHPSDGAPVRLVQTYPANERTFTIDVTVSLAGVRSGPVADVTSVSGTSLWQADFGFEADPEAVLEACRVRFVDAQGREYDTHSGLEVGLDAPIRSLQTCLPEGAEGPSYDYFSDQVTPSEQPRPRSWRSLVVAALPQGVTPVAVRIGFHQPDYVEFRLNR